MKLESKTVVVTGGAGFIGSHLVTRLAGAGCHVVVIDDFSTGSRENLSHIDSSNKKSPNEIEIIKTDLSDIDVLEKAFASATAVFHLATRNVRLSIKQPSLVHRTNTTGTLNVLKASVAAGVKRFLYCSSSEVIGSAADAPQTPEDCLFRPETIYGASKLVGEYYTQVFERSGWLNTVIARPYNAYGPREHYQGHLGEVIPRFILWALAGKPLVIFGDGQQTRDFTYVEETAEYLHRLMECDEAGSKVFNICRGIESSVNELAHAIIKLTNSSSEVLTQPERPSDLRRLCGDPSALSDLLGKSPEITIDVGLEKTADWFKNHVPINDTVLSTLQSQNWDEVEPEKWMRGLDK